jgi:alpha-tubulin N-acetyltransferase 1
MEFRFRIHDDGTTQVMKIDNTLTAEGYENNMELKNKMAFIIDEMGKLSAVAQEIKTPITSAHKLVNSDHMIYMMTEHSTPEHFSVVGILKMGWKKLYLYNKAGSQSEAMVFCLLDFYIHENKQRKGYGKHLFEYMLQDVQLEAKNLAIDKPTNKLLQFMWKHYQLSKLVNQGNNFVIFEEFFNNEVKQNDGKCENRATSYMRQPQFGRHGAHKHHDTMGEIVQGEGDAAFVKFKYNRDPNFVDSQFKEVNPHPHDESSGVNTHSENIGPFKTEEKRDLKFHHSAIW